MGTTVTESIPKYQSVQDALREAIRTGQFKPKEKLASARILAESFQVNRHTMMHALQQLVAEGWLVSKERSGYYVEDNLPIEHSSGGQTLRAFRTVSPSLALELEKPITSEIVDFDYHFGGGLPDFDLFPFDSFRRSLSVMCRKANAHALHYGEITGVPLLKAQILQYLRRARGATFDDVLVCNGSQEALFLIAKLFITPGDKVAIEALGYPPARKAFDSCGAQVVGIRQDKTGICTEHLKSVLSAGRVKLLYLTPLHQYPTTVTLSASKRLEIYQLCYEYGVFIVEDDYDHEFHYACQPLKPMATDDPAQIVIYLSTFSKVMFAGTRTGYLCAPQHLLHPLIALKQLMNHRNDALTQLSIGHWMAEGHFERHLRKMTKAYRLRRDAMINVLNEIKHSGHAMNFEVPDGGMALWVDIMRESSDLKARAWQSKIYIQSEREFHLTPPNVATHIRLGFAAQPEEKARAGLLKLFDL
ncbi:PLP-dependent aminotransferase family protein [Pseudoalteromonas xiamenensis]|uniref:PLP-dependent aminotransferase family protein n=1 Tax=Pseudoalteromonas xiamenensis TaxID=882626 RepID=A0A975DKA6_9GAMM|nr:PLP-dependent aminotransferase family protein [Pseudoalteromonas xiamenensis]QTH73411.1 PLP-dependent aminotransferase family protein [Pseudoalteromonas xiamenensis]